MRIIDLNYHIKKIIIFGLQSCSKLAFKINYTQLDFLWNVNVQKATVCIVIVYIDHTDHFRNKLFWPPYKLNGKPNFYYIPFIFSFSEGRKLLPIHTRPKTEEPYIHSKNIEDNIYCKKESPVIPRRKCNEYWASSPVAISAAAGQWAG